jgi:membrane protein required for colicin V production
MGIELYDILMLVVLVGATLFGALKGMAWQLASLASLVLSYLVALQFSVPLAPYFGEQSPWNRFVAMLALYVGTSLVVWLAFRVVAGLIDRVKLREFDRQIGALFGLAKGACLCVAITLFAVTLAPSQRERIMTSRSGHYIARFIDRADAIMPSEVHEVLAPYLDQLDRKLDPTGELRNAKTTAEPPQ